MFVRQIPQTLSMKSLNIMRNPLSFLVIGFSLYYIHISDQPAGDQSTGDQPSAVINAPVINLPVINAPVINVPRTVCTYCITVRRRCSLLSRTGIWQILGFLSLVENADQLAIHKRLKFNYNIMLYELCAFSLEEV